MHGNFRSLARLVAGMMVGCCGIVDAASARAPGDAMQDLSAALNRLARQANLELVFDSAQLAGIKVPLQSATSPATGPTTALAQLLAPTRFTYRQADARTFVIVSRALKPAGEPLQPPPSAGPEITVIGRLSQNVDLVRGKDEIQPYWIASGQDIEQSGLTSVDDFLRTRLPTNRDTHPLSQAGSSPRSEINLRGLGSDQTLVLVDGRRFASVPPSAGMFGQSDINAIPVEAIDRIEVLATAAGGIFGIGATGGAINVVLKHAYDGLVLSAATGVSEQGDGVEQSIYGQFGWHSRDGRTHVTVSASYSHDDGLLQGDRPFAERTRVLRAGSGDFVVSNALNIQSASGVPLTFTSAYGGGALGASQTYLALGPGALNAAGIAALVAHAGQQDLALSSDAQGAQASLVARTSRFSAMATARQAIGDSTELFLDYMRLEDRGSAQVATLSTGGLYVAAGAAGNPFNQAITVSFPNGAGVGSAPETDVSQRLSGGIIRRFAGGWSLESDLAFSTATMSTASLTQTLFNTPVAFSGTAALDASLGQSDLATTITSSTSTTRMIDANLRVVGPLAMLPGGPATITATGEFRREWSDGEFVNETEVFSGYPEAIKVTNAPYAQDVWSVFGEARLPILAAAGPIAPWRGLTAQLALRLDRYALNAGSAGLDQPIDNKASVFAATAGLQSQPLDGLMLRTSLSTAAKPPTPSQLQAYTGRRTTLGLTDPERGGTQSAFPFSFFDVLYGSTALKPQQTMTFSAGLVAQPAPLPGLRLSVDYTMLSTRHEIVTSEVDDVQYFIDNAALYPGRVQRAPLTARDIAAGYTGGALTSVDVSPLQTGTSHLQTLDVALSQDLPAGPGALRLQADVDWVLSYRRFGDPTTGWYDLVGYADGPIAWRANLGAEWANARWSIGTQAQLYAGYWLADGTPLSAVQVSDIQQYGSTVAQIKADQAREPHVPVQAYFDLSVAFRPLGRNGLQIRLTIANLFDRQPPIAASTVPSPLSRYVDTTTSGVANYGDVLGRRFAVNVRVPFGH